MNGYQIVLALLALVPCAWAGGGFPAPVMSGDEVNLAPCPTELLPVGLREQLRNVPDQIFTDENGELRESYRALTLDLNGDGESETFVADPARYTGGPMIYIFAGESADYRHLGAVQGEFYVAAPSDGYAQLVDTARAGPGSYVRALYVFRDGTYTANKKAEYELDEDGNYVFVKNV